MKSKFTLFIMAIAMLAASCSKDTFNEQDAINAQKDLLNVKYQHEMDLETLKQKGATALQQLLNAAALAQLKLNDSLATKSAIAAKKQDYSVTVVDVVSNAPVADADVTVSSEGKVFNAKTNTQGVATFTALYLFPTSTFLISKTGYAATQILQQNITVGAARLWNNSDLTNEISGTLYIDTDLTNATAEKVAAKVLITASTVVPASNTGSYTVYFPTYTTDGGAYSLKLPAAANGYNLTFDQITADQKLYVNATEDDAVTTFPSSLPRLTTVKTYFNVNVFNVGVPNVYSSYYFKVAADNTGKVLYIPGYYYYGYNQVYMSPIGNQYQIERLSVTSNYSPTGSTLDFSSTTYPANSRVDIEMVDITGTLIATAPKLMGYVGSNGKLTYTYSAEGGSGYIHLKRDANNVLVDGAKGVLTKGIIYDTYNNFYVPNSGASINTAANRYVTSTYLLLNKGDKKVINFYYGSGDTRVKQVY